MCTMLPKSSRHFCLLFSFGHFFFFFFFLQAIQENIKEREEDRNRHHDPISEHLLWLMMHQIRRRQVGWWTNHFTFKLLNSKSILNSPLSYSFVRLFAHTHNTSRMHTCERREEREREKGGEGGRRGREGGREEGREGEGGRLSGSVFACVRAGAMYTILSLLYIQDHLLSFLFFPFIFLSLFLFPSHFL